LLFNSGRLQKWIWERTYNFTFKGQSNPELVSFNYGYALLGDNGIYLEKYKEQINVYQLQLYDYVIHMVGGVRDMQGKVMVEVSCGRGGGFRYLVDEYKPTRAIGVDLSIENVNFCRQSFAQHPVTSSQTEIAFLQGDSQNLDEFFQSKAVDIVVNIESSHCYPDMNQFFNSVKHILKDDGVFIFADFRFAGPDYDALHYLILSHFSVVKHEDIRRGVFQAMDHQSQLKEDLVTEKFPWYMKYVMRNFAGCQGTKMFNDLRTGERMYFAYALKKKKEE
jgi:SAM-dependent methyltransferase